MKNFLLFFSCICVSCFFFFFCVFLFFFFVFCFFFFGFVGFFFGFFFLLLVSLSFL